MAAKISLVITTLLGTYTFNYSETVFSASTLNTLLILAGRIFDVERTQMEIAQIIRYVSCNAGLYFVLCAYGTFL